MFEMLEDGRTLYANEEFLALVNKEFLCIRCRFKKHGKHGSRLHKPPLTAKRESQPILESVASVLRKAVVSKQLAIVLGECKVDYEGRATSRLEPGERLVIIKQDSAVLVHRPAGYLPVNWQPSSSISLLVVGRLEDMGEFTMYVDEKEMRNALAENPSLIEDGLRALAVEKMVGDGYVDVYAVDKAGRHVLIELKRVTATKEAVLQLYKYVESYKVEHGIAPRGVLVAPTFSPAALETALKLGLECKYVDLKKLWELIKRNQRRRATLIDFYERSRNGGPR